MKKARMNISHSRFILFILKIFGEIVTTLFFSTKLTPWPLFIRALIQARALVIFKVKLSTKIIVEDKYFTALILFPCQFIHVKRKLFTS